MNICLLFFIFASFNIANSISLFSNEQHRRTYVSSELTYMTNYFLTQDDNDTYGTEWTFSDLVHNIHSQNVIFAHFLQDGNLAVVVDGNFTKEITRHNLHMVYYYIPELTNQAIEILNRNNIQFETKPEMTYNTIYIAILRFILTMVYSYIIIQCIWLLIILFASKSWQQITPSGIFNNIFGSKSTIVNTSEIKVTFADVAGCDEAKHELTEVVEFLKNPEKFNNAGAVTPRGILLEGPPGTGKTLLARATAGESGVSFITANGSQFIEVYVGVGASRIRTLFENARKNAPCIIFIDEIDAIGRQRAGNNGSNSENDQTLNQLLTNMDGFEQNNGIIIMAATNRSDILDNALTRPGRFDRKVTVGIPDKEGRKQILQIHLKNKRMEVNTNLTAIHDLTAGFSGAELFNLANEAAILSVRYNESHITEKCLLDAYEKMTIGLPKLNKSYDNNIMELVAYHESGHALLAYMFNDMFDIRKVTINANNNGAGGYTLFTPKEQFASFPTKKFMLANIIIALGGRAAEVILYDKHSTETDKYYDNMVFANITDLYITTGASNDLKQANDIARKYVGLLGLGENIGTYVPDTNFIYDTSTKISDSSKNKIDQEIQKMVENAFSVAVSILKQNIDALNKTAQLLLIHKTITDREMNENIQMYYKTIDPLHENLE